MRTKIVVIASSLLFAATAMARDLPVKININPGTALCARGVSSLIEGQKVKVSVSAPGVSDHAKYTYYVSLEGFQADPRDNGRLAEIKTDKKPMHEFKLRHLRPDFEFVNVTFGASVEDENGNSGSATMIMPVSRQVMFRLQTNESCYQTYEPEVVSAIYDNQNDTDQTISTTSGKHVVQTSRVTHDRGWHFSPSIFVGGAGASLIDFDKGRAQSLEHEIEEADSLTVSHTLNPGDAAVLYSQNTRVMNAYGVYKLDACGLSSRLGTAYFEKSETVTNLYKLPANSGDKALQQAITAKAFGRPAVNTCGNVDLSVK